MSANIFLVQTSHMRIIIWEPAFTCGVNSGVSFVIFIMNC